MYPSHLLRNRTHQHPRRALALKRLNLQEKGPAVLASYMLSHQVMCLLHTHSPSSLCVPPPLSLLSLPPSSLSLLPLSVSTSSQENIWTIPNVLSFSRILLSPLLGYQVLCEQYLLAFGLLSIAAVSDVVSQIHTAFLYNIL